MNTRSMSSHKTSTTTMDQVLEKLTNIEREQHVIKTMIDSKIDGLKHELVDTINRKIDETKESFQKEMKHLHDECDDLRSKIKDLEGIVRKEPVEDTDKTVIVYNLKDNGKSVGERVDELLRYLGVSEEIPVAQVKRIPGRNGKTGIVKVAFNSLEAKISVLREKRKLKDSPEYSKVWMKSSRPYGERIAEINFKLILDGMQDGDKYTVTSNGKIVRRDELTRPSANQVGTTGDVQTATVQAAAARGTPRGSPIGRAHLYRGRGVRGGRGQSYSINELNPRDPNRPDMY